MADKEAEHGSSNQILKDYRKCEDNVNAKRDILILIDEYEENKSFGGFEVKYEAGRITFVKDWRGKKY